MKLSEIQAELKGYFIYKNNRDYELGVRTDKDFRLLTENIQYLSFKDRLELTPIRYLLMQVNNNLLDPQTYISDLSYVLPVVDFQVFQDYDNRNAEIEKHKELLNQIQESKSIFGKKKFKLVYIKSHNHLLADKDTQIGYYVIKDNDVVPIDSALLDNTDNAVEVKNLDTLRNALKDDLINQYTENYKEQCRVWDSLN